MVHPDSQDLWLDVNSRRIHCLVAGERGSPVVFLHGGGLDSAALSWGELIGPLSAHHRFFVPDLPGYGLSDKPDIMYTIDFFVEVVHHLLDVLQLEKVCLGGLSMGGAISLAFALRFPTRVEKLILVDTYGVQEKVAAHLLSYLYVQIPFLEELSYWIISRSRSLIRQTLLASIIYDPQLLSPELVDQVYQVARTPHPGKAFISMQRDDVLWNGLKSNFIGRLYELPCPLCFYTDRKIPPFPSPVLSMLIPLSPTPNL
ncbi:MAG TPA: alpha/beta hydrolase [Ktedonobacteraceae bacterium]|jgi:pimeloyl-ACP methyl ester carboxylesterase